MSSTNIIVIDIGSQFTRAGFAGDDCPRHVERTIIGRRKNDDTYVVGSATNQIGTILTSYPIHRGVVTNFEHLEQIFYSTFFEVDAQIGQHPVLLVEPPLNPKSTRERITQFMFETCKVPKLYMASSAFLALYAYGRYTGVVLESGAGVTHVCLNIHFHWQ